MHYIPAEVKSMTLKDIRVLDFNSTSYLAVLVCDTNENAGKLYQIILKYPPLLNLQIDRDTNRFSTTLNFTELDFFLKVHTNVTVEDYPIFTKLINGDVHSITTGSIQRDGHISAAPSIPFTKGQIKVE